MNFTIGDTVDIPWRPERPTIKVNERMYEATARLRSIGIVAAK